LGVALVAINTTIFLYMLREFAGPKNTPALLHFLQTYALVPAKLEQGYLPGLFTYMFLHGDVFHLLGNMICLWAFVQTLEECMGLVRFVIFYVVWGILAGLAHAVMSWGSTVPMIGASGAISGMVGAYVVAFGPLTNIRTLVFFFGVFRVDIPAFVFMLIWVGMDLIGVCTAPATEGGGGIAFYAHLGGFAAGAVTMMFLKAHTLQHVTQTKEGVIEVRRDAKSSPEEVVTEVQAAPTVCPHCGAELDDSDRLADNLMRCPNPECERCIYLEDVAVTTP
jgi:membrane associated rhomboid family serine protease